jgi:hypothetical protein
VEQTELSPAEADAAAAEIFGTGVGMTEVRTADPVFADQLRLSFNRAAADVALPIDFVRTKARGAGEVATGDALIARAALWGIWLTAARRQSDEVCNRIMGGDFRKLALNLTEKERAREQALLRQLLDAGVLSHMPKGGAIRYSVPGWLVGETIARSGLSEEQLGSALSDPESPDRCRAEAALTEAVLASPGRAPAEVLKGL